MIRNKYSEKRERNFEVAVQLEEKEEREEAGSEDSRTKVHLC